MQANPSQRWLMSVRTNQRATRRYPLPPLRIPPRRSPEEGLRYTLEHRQGQRRSIAPFAISMRYRLDLAGEGDFDPADHSLPRRTSTGWNYS